MASKARKAAFLIGRSVLGGYFIYSGINHFKSHRSMTQYAGAKKVPAAQVAVPATGALMLAGGASLVLGLKPRWGALAIITFLAGVSPVMHNFWQVKDPNQRMADQINFTKNMALLGAALALIGVEQWPLSVSGGESKLTEPLRHIRRYAA